MQKPWEIILVMEVLLYVFLWDLRLAFFTEGMNLFTFNLIINNVTSLEVFEWMDIVLNMFQRGREFSVSNYLYRPT